MDFPFYPVPSFFFFPYQSTMLKEGDVCGVAPYFITQTATYVT